MERWKDVVGYEGLYQVSDLGRVRSVVRNPPPVRGPRASRIMRLCRNKLGMVVTFTVDKKGRTLPVHRLVLEAWVGPCPDGYECCHNDGDFRNNTVSNLRWDTRSNNGRDKREHGTHGG